MRYIKRRYIPHVSYQADAHKLDRIKTARTKRCGVCTFEFPEQDTVIERGRLDGAVEVCPECADTYTAEYLAHEEQEVAQGKAESARNLATPPQFSVRGLSESRPAAVTRITNSAGTDVSQSNPLVMTRNSAISLILLGQYFTGAMTFTYPTGITDNSAPVFDTTTDVNGRPLSRVTLSLIAALGMTPGTYSLTVNDGVSKYGHNYTNIFAVR